MDDEVIEQLAAVRETGQVNMFNKSGVQRVAHECDFHELVTFIEDNDNATYIDALQEMGERA